MTEINDYLRVLFARVGVPYCAEHDVPLQKAAYTTWLTPCWGLKKELAF